MGSGFALDPERIVYALISILIAITVHEFMHAWTAWRLGDDTARQLGRISLNPAVHFDPLGFILFLFIIFFPGAPLLAWGRPVPVNTYRLRPLGQLGRKGSMGLVAFAGPLSNVAMAAAAAIPLRIAFEQGTDLGRLGPFLLTFLQLNLGLAAFNMIPVTPLDGSKILVALLPNFWTPILASTERFGFGVILILIFVDRGLNAGLLSGMAGPVFVALLRLVGVGPLFGL